MKATEPNTATVPESRPVSLAELGANVGDVVEINGHPCKVVAMNPGARRLSLVTIPRKRAVIEKEIADRLEKASVEAVRKRANKGQVGQS